MMITKSGKTLKINGNYLAHDGRIIKGQIIVENGIIQDIKKPETKKIPDDSSITLDLDENDIVFPGFLNLHTHIDYNTIPIWDSVKAPWNNRFEWRKDPGYLNDIKNVIGCITNQWKQKNDPSSDCIKNREKILQDDKNWRPIDTVFTVTSEIQAISGGTTCIQEMIGLEHDNPDHSPNILIRSTASASDLDFPQDKIIFSVIDFYRPSPSSTEIPVKTDSLDIFDKGVKKGNIISTLFHLAEGRSGFLNMDQKFDKYSRNEFEEFMKHIRSFERQKIIPMHLSIIHGCGIDVGNKDHIKFLKHYQISVLWAPISNLLLYKDTLCISKLLKQGVNVALGSDWSPSGGKHILEEARFALWFVNLFDKEIKSYDIFKMITTNAAKCLGIGRVGEIKIGNFADFLIFTKPNPESDAITALLSPVSNDDSIKCVIVNGRIVYGNKKTFVDLKIDYQPLPEEGNSAKNKGVSLNSSLDFVMGRDIKRIEFFLKNNIYRSWNRSHFLATDDKEYLSRLEKLKNDISRKSIQVKKFYGL
ncbi:MAG: hypothetical protein CVV30_04700 [Methanomicrobiales archaeon HGW-Methanomicrobiales-1]|jgi:cytosine/adenosine deaminase-related metal-dependent hydrolase|nr:MAG: hypothetical protein CVV30_04700 [Methanomicrobiales archaeon HGW-Methanomicrobiales-1]